MPVQYLGQGTYAQGNNVSVAPGLPSGIQDGDLLVLIAATRTYTGSPAVPSGWTNVSDYTGRALTSSPATFIIATRTYAAGVTAPTVTFTGGGANVSNQAVIFALRDAAPAVVRASSISPARDTGSPLLGTNISTTATTIDGSFLGATEVQQGDYIFLVGVTGNDEVVANRFWNYGTLFTNQTAQGAGGTTTLGTDASLFTVGLTLPYSTGTQSPPQTFFSLQIAMSSGAISTGGVSMLFYSKQTLSFPFSGSGGAAVSGSATVETRNTTVSQTSTGGAKASGDAAASYAQGTITVSGSGGAALSGTATTILDIVEFVYSGSGGVRAGGNAGIANINPRSWYIDPVSGSNANNGTSWQNAFLTFEPLVAGGAYPLLPGDTIKIAKSADEINSLYFLSGVKFNSFSNAGWSTPPGYPLGAPYNTYIKPISKLNTTSGWTSSSSVAGITSQGFSGSGTWMGSNHNWFWLYLNTEAYGANVKLAYQTLSTTLNLSSFSRIEVCAEIRRATALVGPDVANFALRFCSDTLGNTVLLSIPIQPSKIIGKVFAYEGTLPSGVNSISISTGASASGDRCDLYLHGLIACKSYSSADYLGYFTQYRLGNHESALYVPVTRYEESAGEVYAYLAMPQTGPASLNNSSMTFYFRKALMWDYIGLRSFADSGQQNLIPGDFTALRTLIDTYKVNPIFNLIDVNGTAGNPINIVGGYDPNTNTVTGKTVFTLRGAYIYSSSGNCAIAIGNTSYVNMSNIDISTFVQPGWAFTEASHHLGYENMEIGTVFLPVSTRGGLDTFVRKYDSTTMSATDLYFKNCKGTFFPNALRTANEYHDGSCLLPGSSLRNATLENCILANYCHPSLYQQSINPLPAPLTMVGDLKVYPLAANTLSATGDYLNGAPVTLSLPQIKSGATGTLYVYGAGVIGVPTGADYGQNSGAYVFPKMVMENSMPLFYEPGSYLSSAYVGRCEMATLPELTITLTSSSFSQHSFTNGSSYSVNGLVTVGSMPPFQINKLTHNGAQMSGMSSGTGYTAIYRSVSTWPETVGIKNIAYSTNSWYRPLFSYNATFTNAPKSTDSFVPLVILDTITGLGRSLTQDQGVAFNYTFGHFEVRNTQWATTGSFGLNASPGSANNGSTRYVNCSFTNANGTAAIQTFQTPTGHGGSQNKHWGNSGPGTGVVLVDTTASLAAGTITAPYVSPTAEESSSYGIDTTTSLTVINNTTNAHTVWGPFRVLSKDYTTYHTAPFAWKSLLRMNIRQPLSCTYPLGSYPVKTGRVLTITLWVKLNSISNTYMALVVHHNGCANSPTSENLTEKIVVTTATTDWQQLTSQFTVGTSGMIDVEVSHFGATGSIGWFDDVRILEQ